MSKELTTRQQDAIEDLRKTKPESRVLPVSVGTPLVKAGYLEKVEDGGGHGKARAAYRAA